jgi:NtrC-family two-component system sensor histidine kinase KinB
MLNSPAIKAYHVYRGGSMSLRSKLSIGLGFLFLIILAIAVYSSIQIGALSRDADNILKDNYDSLVHCKNMLLALDHMNVTVASRIFDQSMGKATVFNTNLFETSREAFEKNLRDEKGNITEPHEGDYVGELSAAYTVYLKIAAQLAAEGGTSSRYFKEYLPSHESVRDAIVSINDVNMQAIERKSIKANGDAHRMIASMAVIGAICIILGFFYFWYFPFYISNSMAFLAVRMKELLKVAGLTIDTRSSDEAFILLHSIDVLENSMRKPGTGKT